MPLPKGTAFPKIRLGHLEVDLAECEAERTHLVVLLPSLIHLPLRVGRGKEDVVGGSDLTDRQVTTNQHHWPRLLWSLRFLCAGAAGDGEDDA